MGFNELAQYYLPHIQPASASIRLSSWIKQHQVLSEKLRESGYKSRLKVLTPKMVRLIVYYLGDP
ncbi:MAG: DUF4248 domain-containing protein [Schleiferiaceae bacterium]